VPSYTFSSFLLISFLPLKIVVMTGQEFDATAMRIHLNELKSQFDNAMRDGEVFANLKKVYMEIKELECCLKVIEWQQVDRGRTDGFYNRLQNPLL
jgi:hypothetical protein